LIEIIIRTLTEIKAIIRAITSLNMWKESVTNVIEFVMRPAIISRKKNKAIITSITDSRTVSEHPNLVPLCSWLWL
jgi:hypothetical protein